MATWKSASQRRRRASKSSKEGAPPLAVLNTPPTADEVQMMVEARAKALRQFSAPHPSVWRSSAKLRVLRGAADPVSQLALDGRGVV